MKAAVLRSPKQLSVEEVATPSIEEDEILVKIESRLTCGTDVKLYKRGHPLAKLPLIIGHEFSGTVWKVGQKVTKFLKGMRVTSANSAPCNNCFFCARGQHNLCENIASSLIGFSIDGTYSEFVRIPENIVEQNTLQIPDDVAFEEAAILEPLACAVHGIELSDVTHGYSVAIIGSGPIGLLLLQLAKSAGANPVVVTNRTSNRLEHAKRLGADNVVISSQENQVEAVRELTDGRGADVVIEAVGKPETWQEAIKMTRKGGTALMFGGCPVGTTIQLDAYRLHYEELTIRGAFHHTPASVRKAMDLIASRKVDAKALITHKMKLSQTAEALELMDGGTALKVLIQT